MLTLTQRALEKIPVPVIFEREFTRLLQYEGLDSAVSYLIREYDLDADEAQALYDFLAETITLAA